MEENTFLKILTILNKTNLANVLQQQWTKWDDTRQRERQTKYTHEGVEDNQGGGRQMKQVWSLG